MIVRKESDKPRIIKKVIHWKKKNKSKTKKK